MKNISYTCDLCVSSFSPDNLVGIKWMGETIVTTNVYDCERHFCQNCAQKLLVTLEKWRDSQNGDG